MRRLQTLSIPAENNGFGDNMIVWMDMDVVIFFLGVGKSNQVIGYRTIN